MENRTRRFFANDTVFLWMTVLTVIFMVYNTVLGIIGGYEIDSVFCAVYAACVIGIYITFRKHEKSATKYLVGMVLGMMTVGVITDAVDEFETYLSADKYWCAFIAVRTLCTVTFVILHLVLSLNHESKPGCITVSHICIFLFLVTTVLMCIDEIMTGEEYAVLYTISYISYLFLMSCVVCIDTKVDTFKEKRSINEAAKKTK